MLVGLINLIKKHITPKPSYILYTLLGFLFLNAFWLIASQWVFVFRPYINYDYGLALLLAPFSIVLCVLALLVVYALELFMINSLIFHFDSPQAFFRSTEFMGELQLQDFLNWQDIFLLLLFLAFSISCAWFLKKRTNGIAAVIVVMLSFAADQLNGSSYLIKRDDQIIGGNIAGSSLLQVYTSFKEKEDTANPVSFIAAHELPVSAEDMTAWADENPEKSVLFIVVESMGANNSSEADLWLLSQLGKNGLAASYDIDYGTTAFKGATTASELRHLCGIEADYTSELTEDITKNCLPKIFAAKGYEVIGTHGFSGNMFRRSKWWPVIGITEPLFVNTFNEMNAPYCGSGLHGTCDEFIVDYLGDRMRAKKGFYYQLTLNMHLPIVKTPVPDDLQAICTDAEMTRESCMLNAKAGEYLRALSAMIADLPVKPFVYIAGDHAPPFSGKASRQNFSNAETPYFVLRPLMESKKRTRY